MSITRIVAKYLKNNSLLTNRLLQVKNLPITRPQVGEGNGTPLQSSCLENPMDGGAWWATVHGVAKSRTRLSDFPFTFHFHALEKEMATHSSILAWRIPGTGEPGGLPSVGSHSRTWLKWLSVQTEIRVNIEVSLSVFLHSRRTALWYLLSTIICNIPLSVFLL